jgi:hypothetical protein
VDGDKSEHEDGESSRLFVDVSCSVSRGEESHQSFVANLSGPFLGLGLHYSERSLLRVLVGYEAFHEAVEVGVFVLPVLS